LPADLLDFISPHSTRAWDPPDARSRALEFSVTAKHERGVLALQVYEGGIMNTNCRT